MENKGVVTLTERKITAQCHLSRKCSRVFAKLIYDACLYSGSLARLILRTSRTTKNVEKSQNHFSPSYIPNNSAASSFVLTTYDPRCLCICLS